MRQLLLAILVFICAANLKAQTTDSFVVDGVYRNYIVHVPTGYIASTAYPLVLNLHGYTSNAAQEMFYTTMNNTADANHFIVVYPNGISNYWNAFGVGADDVKFLRELIDTISAHYNVNANRVYSCGMSNGGYMSYTLACELSTKIAAIASVAGTMSLNTYNTCNPARKMPVMHIHGTTDPTVNYATGAANSVGVEQTLNYWRDTNQCSSVIDTTALPNTSTTDNSTVQLIVNSHCAPFKEVRFYKIANGGHTWPSAFIDVPTYGNTNRDFNASQEIWNFFNRFSLDNTASIAETATERTVTLYPIPVGNTLNIQTDLRPESAQILDVSGRVLGSYSEFPSIDVSALSSGMYLLQLQLHNAGSQVYRFIKQ
jgi:polyhydroxybutyrate depolymerase